jgi:two-component system sensor histidine kinase MtrB
VEEGLLLHGGVQGSPVLRLFTRWVRRPLLPAARLWRRNIQLRVVATTLLMSLCVVLLLGFVVIGQVRNGLLDAKVRASQSQADGGFRAAKDKADAASTDSGGQSTTTTGRPEQNAAAWMNDLVGQLSSGGQSAFDVVTLNPGGDGDDGSVRAPRASGGVDPIQSVPDGLRSRIARSAGASQSYTRIIYSDDQQSQPGLVIGKQLNGLNGDSYQLYYLFPLSQEEKSLSLVKGTLATAGLFVVVLLGAIAWLVVRQVVTPVRMAAGIAERLSAGRLQERMKVTGEDDIARLGEAFNKMAQNLQLKIQQLEDLSRMQRRFVSDVSHELRTPLTTVRMAADVIHEARADFDPVTARSAELLADQLDRFESLLADLLEISRFDAGAAALEAEPVDLREVVRRVVGGAEPLAERKGTRVRIVGDQQPVVAEADARRVERVLRNLVVNAVEHGEGKDVVVRLAAAGGAVAVAVRDYGVGLKPGEATRAFSRFWRADPARARTTGGTGLGLSIALEDARLHGGWLQAWGEPGGGSQFRLTLPRTADEPLRGSPIPLEPDDSRRNRGPNDVGLPQRRTVAPARPTQRPPLTGPPPVTQAGPPPVPQAAPQAPAEVASPQAPGEVVSPQAPAEVASPQAPDVNALDRAAPDLNALDRAVSGARAEGPVRRARPAYRQDAPGAADAPGVADGPDAGDADRTADVDRRADAAPQAAGDEDVPGVPDAAGLAAVPAGEQGPQAGRVARTTQAIQAQAAQAAQVSEGGAFRG